MSDFEELLIKHSQNEASRLDRIEEKLDKLTDTIVALARAEEKLVGLEVDKVETKKRLDEHEERLDRHSERLNNGAVTLNTISKIFWITVAAGVAVALDLYLR